MNSSSIGMDLNSGLTMLDSTHLPLHIHFPSSLPCPKPWRLTYKDCVIGLSLPLVSHWVWPMRSTSRRWVEGGEWGCCIHSHHFLPAWFPWSHPKARCACPLKLCISFYPQSSLHNYFPSGSSSYSFPSPAQARGAHPVVNSPEILHYFLQFPHNLPTPL